jgi:hypothetical protein
MAFILPENSVANGHRTFPLRASSRLGGDQTVKSRELKYFDRAGVLAEQGN